MKFSNKNINKYHNKIGNISFILFKIKFISINNIKNN